MTNSAGASEDFNALSDDEFRVVARRFVEQHYPAELRNPLRRLHWRDNRPWYMMLAEHGWLAPGWPREHGGMGLSASKYLILIEEFERHGCARVSDMGMVMLGPLLIRYGTPEQKDIFLPKILAGDHIWCQGYTEPNAGSDLAVAAYRGSARRRPLRGQRPEDLDHARQRRQLDLHAGAHRQGRQEAGRHQLPAGADGHARASRCGRSSTSTCTTSSARCSSTTCGCRRRTWSARSTRAGPWRRRCSASSASPSARPSCPSYALGRLKLLAERMGV